MDRVKNFANSGAESMRDPGYDKRGTPLHLRNIIMGVEIENEDGDGLVTIKNAGDWQNFLFWKSISQEARSIGSWSSCMPVRCMGGGMFQPVKGPDFAVDDRYEPINLAIPPNRDGPPATGEIGIAVGSTKEDGDQVGYFLGFGSSGSSNDIKAPNNPGSYFESGTNVYELDGMNLANYAKLQRVFRVIQPSAPSKSQVQQNAQGAAAWLGDLKKFYGKKNGRPNPFADIVNVGLQNSDGTFGSKNLWGFKNNPIPGPGGKFQVGVQGSDGKFGGGGFGLGNFGQGQVGIQGADPKGLILKKKVSVGPKAPPGMGQQPGINGPAPQKGVVDQAAKNAAAKKAWENSKEGKAAWK